MKTKSVLRYYCMRCGSSGDRADSKQCDAPVSDVCPRCRSNDVEIECVQVAETMIAVPVAQERMAS